MDTSDMRADNLGLDPLPDIDFNIRCGNTLVGYATEGQLNNDLNYGDMFANLKFRSDIELEMDKVAHTFDRFRTLQLSQSASDMQAFKVAKNELRNDLEKLNNSLNKKLFASNGGNKTYQQWLEDVQPFHWLAEYYQIIHGNGGFDVIIGNPPYLESNQINYNIDESYKTLDSGAVHAYCIERSLSILRGNISMIVPIALTCTQRMIVVQKLLEKERDIWYSNFAWRPAKLFDAVNRALSIFIANKSTMGQHLCYTTEYIKWVSENRASLMHKLSYTGFNDNRTSFWVPKIHSKTEISILHKMQIQKHTLNNYVLSVGSGKMYYRTTGGLYWKVFTNFSPKFICNGIEGKSSRETSLNVEDQNSSVSLVAFYTSDIFWWWYTITSNLRDLNPSDLYGIRIPDKSISSNALQGLGLRLLDDLKAHSSLLTREQKNKGTTQTQSFKVAKSKPIIDEIDKVLAKHYGFTEEELDFIINYDIKYRMGDELSEE